jgi:hypothetical protein
MNEARGVVEAELSDDVVLHLGCGRGGERDDRRRPEQGKPLAEHPVIGPEIVPPLRDTVSLVDGDERGSALGQHLGKAGDAEALGGDEEEIEPAREVIDARLS